MLTHNVFQTVPCRESSLLCPSTGKEEGQGPRSTCRSTPQYSSFRLGHLPPCLERLFADLSWPCPGQVQSSPALDTLALLKADFGADQVHPEADILTAADAFRGHLAFPLSGSKLLERVLAECPALICGLVCSTLAGFVFALPTFSESYEKDAGTSFFALIMFGGCEMPLS